MDNQEKVTCNICGAEMQNNDPAEMAEHIVFNHPMQLLQNRNFQKRVFSIMEYAGGKFADFLKGTLKNG